MRNTNIAQSGRGTASGNIGVAEREFELTDNAFREIVSRIHQATGIVLGDSKRDLVYGRLGRRLRSAGCRNFAEYLALLDGPDAEAEQVILVNAITTNLTGFFREPHHFQVLANDMLGSMAKSPPVGRRVRIWSAGCSSGEEPYSIAMTMLNTIPGIKNWNAQILATDIDSDMIAACRAGLYEKAKTAPIPAGLQRAYIRPVDDATCEMGETLKSLVSFRQLNLLGGWPMRGPFDAIFCRNVVIYFDKDTQRTLFDRFADLLAPEGWLFIGHSESLNRVSTRFRHLGQTVYRKIH